MASLELVNLIRVTPDISDGAVFWPQITDHPTEPTPLIFWRDGSPWREANLWANHKATGTEFATLYSLMSHLLAYGKWLERNGIDWWHFPELESQRCLYRFRGALKLAMKHGEISSQTASNRMRALTQFYRWVAAMGILSTNWPMWRERHFGIRLTDMFGFERTLSTRSTNLAISAKKTVGEALEGGLYPVTKETERCILKFVCENGTPELLHMLGLGFRTGMRLGTIADLKILSLQRATPDPLMTGFLRVQVGPNAHPPVATKHGVNGAVRIHQGDLDTLIAYATDTRRLLRQARADSKDRNLLFLTKAGHAYAGSGQGNHRAVQMELSRLKQLAIRQGDPCLIDFHFHRSRATFGSNIAKILLSRLPTPDALGLLQELMLHADVATSLKYVKFAEKSKALEDASDAYSREFLKLGDRYEQKDS